MWITRGSTVAAWCVVHFQVQVKKLVLLLATSHAINDVFFMLRNDCPEKILFRQKFEGESFFFFI